MPATTLFVLKRGATAASFTVTLKDIDGPVDLSDYEWVKFYAKREGRNLVPIHGEVCNIVTDQVNLKGKVTYNFDDTIADTIPLGEYNVEFHGKDENGEIHIFPSSLAEPFGQLVVINSIA